MKPTFAIILLAAIATQVLTTGSDDACISELGVVKSTLKGLNTQGRRDCLLKMAKTCMSVNSGTFYELVGTHIDPKGGCRVNTMSVAYSYGAGTNTDTDLLDRFAETIITKCKLVDNQQASTPTPTPTPSPTTQPDTCAGNLQKLKSTFKGLNTQQRRDFVMNLAKSCSNEDTNNLMTLVGANVNQDLGCKVNTMSAILTFKSGDASDTSKLDSMSNTIVTKCEL